MRPMVKTTKQTHRNTYTHTLTNTSLSQLPIEVYGTLKSTIKETHKITKTDTPIFLKKTLELIQERRTKSLYSNRLPTG